MLETRAVEIQTMPLLHWFTALGKGLRGEDGSIEEIKGGNNLWLSSLLHPPMVPDNQEVNTLCEIFYR